MMSLRSKPMIDLKVLLDILPEAFAVVKASRRLAENKELKVTAQDFDKDLASEFDFVTIDGDQAIWSNKWLAFGAEQIWNMVHYDVQLIGGSVLHEERLLKCKQVKVKLWLLHFLFT